jgi:hypothetical protein
MELSRSSLFCLSRRILLSLCCLALSYGYDLIASLMTVVLPWLFSLCGVLGLVSVLWLLFVGPVHMNYDRVFAFHDRCVSPFRAQLILWIAIHGFWLLQSLDLLVDEYPQRSPIRRTGYEATVNH